MIEVNSDGSQVLLKLSLENGSAVDVKMDAETAKQLAQSLVIHAAFATKTDNNPKKSIKTEEKPIKTGFDSFMDDVNKAVTDAAKGIKNEK